jgi:hypothetical protein
MNNYCVTSYFINNLLCEKKFLEERLSVLPSKSRITRINIESKLKEIAVKLQEYREIM